VAKKARTAWQTVHQMSTIDWEERAVKGDRRERGRWIREYAK